MKIEALIKLSTLFCLGGLFALVYIGREDTMKVCQLSHSFDTCFEALNR